MARTTYVLTILTAGILCCAAGAATAGDWDIPTDPSKFAIFILDGQSNMVGAAPLAQGDAAAVPHVLRLDGQANPNGTIPIPIGWSHATQPLFNAQNLNPNVGYSLGIEFAKQYQVKHPGVTVGLISAAWGGAGIDSLKKGSIMYSNMIDRAKYAVKSGTIKGFLWHQGETDTCDKGLADAYAKKLDKLVGDVRADLGLPDLPFIVGNLAEFYGIGGGHDSPQQLANIKVVRAALKGLPDRVQNTAWVSTEGLTSMDANNVHFDRASLISLGRRYEAAYNKLTHAPESGRKY